MKKGQEKDFRIEPDEAYGEKDPNAVQKIPREHLPKDQEPKEGMILSLRTPDGQQFPAKIIKVTKEDVTIDVNHPLAGKALNFKIKLLDIN